MYATLVVVRGNADKRHINIKLPTVLGRSRQADLTIAHLQISRRHCELNQREGVVLLTDLGSLNGTYCRDHKIQRVPLLPNDQFSIGPLTFEIHYVCDERDDPDFQVDTVLAVTALPFELSDPAHSPLVELDNPLEVSDSPAYTVRLAEIRRTRNLAGFTYREADAKQQGIRDSRTDGVIEINGPHPIARAAAVPFDAPTSQSPAPHTEEAHHSLDASPDRPDDRT